MTPRPVVLIGSPGRKPPLQNLAALDGDRGRWPRSQRFWADVDDRLTLIDELPSPSVSNIAGTAVYLLGREPVVEPVDRLPLTFISLRRRVVHHRLAFAAAFNFFHRIDDGRYGWPAR